MLKEPRRPAPLIPKAEPYLVGVPVYKHYKGCAVQKVPNAKSRDTKKYVVAAPEGYHLNGEVFAYAPSLFECDVLVDLNLMIDEKSYVHKRSA